MVVVVVGVLLLPGWSGAAVAAPQPVRDYLLLGAPADLQTPQRGCGPGMLHGPRQQLAIAAPPGGWSGQPQALAVFNIFAGEVRIRQGAREVCGNMGDARTRDSRFRASVGTVLVPRAGSVEPIEVSWATPLKERWGPTLRLGAPSPVQQDDTARLLIRAACLAIALALALTALMASLSARDRLFLAYVGLCAVFVVWQAVLGGLSGYPEPWFPIGVDSAWWLVGLTAVTQSLLVPVIWQLCGAARQWPGSARVVSAIALSLLCVGLLVPWMDWYLLGWVSDGIEAMHFTTTALAAVAAMVALVRGDRGAGIGVLALLPFLVMNASDAAGATWVLAYRVEALQLSVTWVLMMTAYALNQRLGQLRAQRDEMRQLADTDALTGLANRRAGLRQLALQAERAGHECTPLVVGFLDIDLFKEINDRHGHDVGDAVLVAVAGALRAATRGHDEVFRMGGEEFLLVLPSVPRQAALHRLGVVCEQVVDAGASLGVEGLEVTASIGLAQWRPGDEVASLLRRADHAMYAAKRAGRNRVVDGETGAVALARSEVRVRTAVDAG